MIVFFIPLSFIKDKLFILVLCHKLYFLMDKCTLSCISLVDTLLGFVDLELNTHFDFAVFFYILDPIWFCFAFTFQVFFWVSGKLVGCRH